MPMTKKNVTLLDGGMGMWLKKKGLPIDNILWSARMLVEEKYHSEVVAAHRDFIEAGAEVITTSNYSTIPLYLEREGHGNRYAELTELCGKLASQARSECSKKGSKQIRIAGSIPPLQESYNPDEVLEDTEYMVDVYTNIAQALDPYVDVFLVETLTASREAKCALEAVTKFKKPIWLSFSVLSNGNIRSGETIDEVFEAIGARLLKNVSLLSFNCSTPEEITEALKRVTDSMVLPKNMQLGAYPNGIISLESFHLHRDGFSTRRDDLDDQKLIDFVSQWIQLGVTVVGGCCRIHPHSIRAIKRFLSNDAKL